MEEQIKQAVRNLRIQYLLFWILPVLLVTCYELNLFAIGCFADDPQQQYIWETLGVLLSIICIPSSLKLFNTILKNKIDTVAFPVALKKYVLWCVIRLSILEVAVLFNIIVYYSTLNNIGGFCALIGLIASAFCLPGEKRLRQELRISKESN